MGSRLRGAARQSDSRGKHRGQYHGLYAARVRDLDSDDAVAILENLPQDEQTEILQQLPPSERVALSHTGTLWGWTAVTAPPPGYRGDVPFGFGVVELPEGIRVITRVEEPDPARLSFGMPVRFSTVPLHTDDEGTTVVTYTFVPAAAP